MRDAGEPDEQRGAHLLGVEEIADADGARHHGAALEIRDVVRRERRVDGGAEPGVQAIDRPIAGGEALDHGAGTAQARRARRCEANLPPSAATVDDDPRRRSRRSPSSTAPDVSGAPPWP